MKTSLTKNQLAYILSSTANPQIRPTLSYTYYLADTHVVVSTDSYSLHEIQGIDLWPDNLIIDTKGIHHMPETYHKFPEYLRFFPSNPSHNFKTTLNVSNVKLARDIAKVSLDKYTVTINKWIISAYEPSAYKNLDTFNFSTKLYKQLTEYNNPPSILLNVDYLYNHTRYIDKPHLATISISDPLNPIIFESLIDNTPVRTLIMPLKI